jgi:CO dehydrogenase/acetyl-CoA synthase beta subunit
MLDIMHRMAHLLEATLLQLVIMEMEPAEPKLQWTRENLTSLNRLMEKERENEVDHRWEKEEQMNTTMLTLRVEQVQIQHHLTKCSIKLRIYNVSEITMHKRLLLKRKRTLT